MTSSPPPKRAHKDSSSESPSKATDTAERMLAVTETAVRDATQALELDAEDMEVQLAVADLRLGLALQPKAKMQLEGLKTVLNHLVRLKEMAIHSVATIIGEHQNE